MSEGAVVGIDLGTTYSVCAIVEDGKPRVISDTGGSFTIPSIVAIDDKGNRLVGQAAKRQSEINPVNTVYGAKRLLGRDIHSHVVDEIEEHFKYRLEEGDHEDVAVRLRKESFSLEEIQAVILDHIRNTAQDMLGEEITKAVVTVPAYFNDRQRQAVRDAGKIAQLEVLRIVNEPTAAALAYGHGKGLQQKVAIYDLGGGTFDVTVLEVRDNVFEVKATGGNTFLGGVDFDNRLIEHVIGEFKDQHGIDLNKDPVSHQRVKDACEQAKIDLSTRAESRIHIPYIAQGKDGPLNIDTAITKDKFEELIGPGVKETLDIARKVIDESGWKLAEIDAVLLVGGSTRVPLVARMVEDYFRKAPSKNVHPDEAVALGAAILADAIVNKDSEIMLLDVLPINLNIGLPGDKVLPVFNRNTSVPNQKKKVFTTSKDNQDSLKIKLVQGDSDKASECESIGEFTFRGIHPAPKGKAKVEVVFKIDAEGILHLTAKDPDTGTEQTGMLQMSGTIQKTFKKDLIKKKAPVAKKESKKVISTSVTREKKITAPKPTDSKPKMQKADVKFSNGPLFDDKSKKPSAPAKKAPAKKAAPQKSSTPPPPPPPPAKEPKPGIIDRIKAWLKRS